MDYAAYKDLSFRRKFWKLFGASIQVRTSDEQSVGYIEMKAWKLREDIRLYTDNTKQQELLRIHARQVIDFAATYDVFDSSTDQLLFSLRRKGLRSTFVRDHWLIMDASGSQIAEVRETSGGLALARRYFGIVPIFGEIVDLAFMFLPLSYDVNSIIGGASAGTASKIIHRKNPVVVTMDLSMSDQPAALDHRVSIAVTALLSVIDASKN